MQPNSALSRPLFSLLWRAIDCTPDTQKRDIVNNENTINDQLLTEKELAEMLKISEATARRWRAVGAGPEFVRCGPALVRYQLSTVERWLAESVKI